MIDKSIKKKMKYTKILNVKIINNPILKTH